MFSLESTSVTFPKGVAEVDTEVLYDMSELEIGSSYSFTIALADPALVSLGGITSTAVKGSIKLEWEDYATCRFIYSFFGGVDDVVVLKAKGLDLYRILDCYATGFNLEFSLKEDGTIATCAEQNTGINYDEANGDIYVRYLSSKREGKTLSIEFKYTLPKSGASFQGTFVDTIVFP